MGVPQILMYLMIVIYFGSLYKIFTKAGRQAWEGFVPVYNIWVWLKVIKKPWWWIFFFAIPFVNFIIAVACNVETARLFGKYSAKETLLTIFVPWYFIPFLAHKEENVICVETDWSNEDHRNIRKTHDQITLFAIAPLVGHALVTVFRLTGSKDKPNKKTLAKEWTDALGFAIVAATIIRTFFFEAFTIPTGSLEKTMLIGDFLFVNKVKYGPKLPETPMSVPFVHNVIPGTLSKSYVEWFKIDYTRLPGYGKVDRGDITVFNWPAGDTVILEPFLIAHEYEQIVRDEALLMGYQQSGGQPLKAYMEQNGPRLLNAARQNLIRKGGNILSRRDRSTGAPRVSGGLTTRPTDKKENYIKRCVGIAGDSLEIIDGIVHVNGIPEDLSPTAQMNYTLYTTESNISPIMMKDNYDINLESFQKMQSPDNPIVTQYVFPVSRSVYERIISEQAWIDSSHVNLRPADFDYLSYGQYYPIFPKSGREDFQWSRDNMGPFYLPKRGDKIELTEHNFIFYRRAIEAYEKNEVQVVNGKYLINGEVATHYTFKMNYYWLMGDNRHGSVDSRMWGYVAEDHIVGTAAFVWFSKDPERGFLDGIRWSRIFSLVD